MKNLAGQEQVKNPIIVYRKTLAEEYSKIYAIKQDIEWCLNTYFDLTLLKTNFKTPYDGYLSIKAKSCEILFDDNSSILIKSNVKNFYLSKGEIIRIINPIHLKKVIFKPMSSSRL